MPINRFDESSTTERSTGASTDAGTASVGHAPGTASAHGSGCALVLRASELRTSAIRTEPALHARVSIF